jgi:hypothetical protein
MSWQTVLTALTVTRFSTLELILIVRVPALLRRTLLVQVVEDESGMLGFFWSLTLSQACPRPTAVFIDELDARCF